ncbi:exonuclease SbcCD subunit D C-terminal domain-containing protein [Thiocystis violacea]|uniref:exonuclease SbcCD subunit D C-terminal domain-containing protein n=1 Tax=Thiocystis violacea TaxID=13725 RepID=UPI00190732BF|nr:exonuclease SbcCD subunit D C-terminal domain-containing protein [Thiocystis violacea]MBK1721089.1 exonuclease sbcCD subunit D [Thiocystis violacea]
MKDQSRPLKLLHTSDWHLGRSLYGRKRYEEFEAFLGWLAETIVRERIDVLLVAGDIFDTSAPSHRAQALYYGFLCKVAASACRHVVVVAGNHDSPSFLSAPKALLRALDVHVIGSATEELADEVVVLTDSAGAAELIVCAVPYLRDRDIRTAEAGETIEDKDRKLLDGIRGHYADVAEIAERRRAEWGRPVPIVGTGHLFAAGGQTVEGDGVRELYVGSLAHVPAGIFPACFDYLALGHLHVPQKVGGLETRRYSGSPLPMGFGEAGQAKSLCLVELSGGDAAVRLVEIPVFQHLERVRGTWDAIAARILELTATRRDAWLEVVYEGEEMMSDLRQRLELAVEGSGLEILRVRNNRIVERVLERMEEEEHLADLEVGEVFERCLAAHGILAEEQSELRRAYQEILHALHDADPLAE